MQNGQTRLRHLLQILLPLLLRQAGDGLVVLQERLQAAVQLGQHLRDVPVPRLWAGSIGVGCFCRMNCSE